ncbi:MAG: hypothetical protein QW225_04325 [Candidatus Jordarchaeales archaeon]
MSFFPVFEVHEELSKLIKDPFRGFVLVGESGFLVDTSFDDEEATNTTIMVANWLKIALDRIKSELKIDENHVTVFLSLRDVSYLFRQLGSEIYAVFVLSGAAPLPVLGKDEELALQKVEFLIEGKPIEEIEAATVERPTVVLTGRIEDPYETAETALKLFKDAVSRIEAGLAGSSMLSDLNALAAAAQRLEGTLSVFRRTLEQLGSYSRDISRLSELTSSLTSALDSMKNYSEKLLEMLKSVRETVVSSQTSMKPSFVEATINELKVSIEASQSASEAAEKLNEAVKRLVENIGYVHPALYEMRSYYRLFKESSPEAYNALKNEFLASIERWKMRLMSVERVLSG